MGNSHFCDFLLQRCLKTVGSHANTRELVKLGILAQRATRHEEKRGECFAPCFATFSFAQRRADDPKITSEASGETLKSPEIEILATL